MKLTDHSTAAILSAPRHIEVGIRTPLEIGAKIATVIVVFSFLPAVFVTGLFRAKFVMTGKLIGETLRLTAPIRGSSNPTKNPAAKRLEPVCGVFSRIGNL